MERTKNATAHEGKTTLHSQTLPIYWSVECIAVVWLAYIYAAYHAKKLSVVSVVVVFVVVFVVVCETKHKKKMFLWLLDRGRQRRIPLPGQKTTSLRNEEKKMATRSSDKNRQKHSLRNPLTAYSLDTVVK